MTSRLSAAAGSLALLWSLQAFAQCAKDTDCKGDRICQNGTCVNAEPSSAPLPSPPPPPPSAAPTRPAGGGEAPMGAYRMAIKAHPLDTIGGLLLGVAGGGAVFAVHGELEYALAPNFSLFGDLMPLVAFSQLGVLPGILAGGGVRFYPFAEALRGFWLGGYFALTALGGVGFDVQAQGGYAWIFDNGFYIGVGGALSFVALANLAAGGNTLPVGIQVPIGIAF